MEWLTNWDDLIHGTAVFGAAVPLCTAVLLGCLLPRWLWVAVLAALAVPLLWLFGLPPVPPASSDHAMVSALAVAAVLVGLESWWNISWWRRPLLRFVAWTALAWPLYPAWLAQEGDTTRQFIVTASVGASIAVWASLMEFLARDAGTQLKRGVGIGPAPFVPATVALAVLLQLGGSMQFAQSAGALAAAVGGVCLVLMWKPAGSGWRRGAAVWGMLAGWMAWSGWLFAEVEVLAAILVLGAPLLALAANLLPLPRRRPIQVMLWEAILSGILSGIIAWLVWQMSQGAADSMGY